MKKLFVIIALSVFAVSCGSSESTEVTVDSPATTVIVDSPVAPVTVDTTAKVDTTVKADTTKK